MSDRRDLPERFRGAVGEAASIGPFAAFLYAAPDGPRDRQLVRGEAVTIHARDNGWAFVRSGKDGYCGHLPEGALALPFAPTHVVQARQTHLYPVAGMKQPPLARLAFGARLVVEGLEGRWARTPGGFVHRSHIRKPDEVERDPVAVAERFLGTPYLWAGNTGDGIDCSGLVQAAMLACGIPCPGDTDQQAAALGEAVAPDAKVQRGDLFFWKDHVAMAADAERIVHATAYRMAVTYERLEEAIDRIDAQGEGPVTTRRRVPRGQIFKENLS